METYSEMNARIQKEINALPLYWAFSKSQWDETLKKLNISDEEASEKLCRGPGSSFVLKSDADMIKSTMERHAYELDEAMKNIDFFKQAVKYEMGNHEYHINYQGDYDVLSALGFECEYRNEFKSAGLTAEQITAYNEVRNEYLREADEKGWY